jgi:hypothetical protein
VLLLALKKVENDSDFKLDLSSPVSTGLKLLVCQYYEWCELGVAEDSPRHPTSHFMFRLSYSNIYYYSNMELEKLLVTYKL